MSSPPLTLCSPPPPRKAKLMLDDIVSRGRGGPPGQFHDNANGQNGTVQEIMIPAGKAGLVIGKGGETIKQLQVGTPPLPPPKTPPVPPMWFLGSFRGVLGGFQARFLTPPPPLRSAQG